MSTPDYDASKIADALTKLGYGPGRMPSAGLKVVEWARGPEADTEPDDDYLKKMEAFFLEGDGDAEEHKLDPEPITKFFDSEYMVVDELILAMDPIGGNMPWVAEPIYAMLDEYEKYLKEFKAPKHLFDRLTRITHAVSDIEMKAAGRG